MRTINPDELGAPHGYAHGIVVPAGARLVFVAGQTAAVEGGAATGDFTSQFDAALGKALKVVEAAGGCPQHVVRMTLYVTDLGAYRQSRAAIGERWRRRMGGHYPAMTLVEVARLHDAGALVEIEATAALPG